MQKSVDPHPPEGDAARDDRPEDRPAYGGADRAGPLTSRAAIVVGKLGTAVRVLPRKLCRFLFIDHIWAFLGASGTASLIAIAAIFVPMYFEKYRAIEFQFADRHKYRPSAFGRHWGLRLTHEGKVVDDPYEWFLTVRNKGTLAITLEDFNSNAVFIVQPKSKILAVKMDGSSEKGLGSTCGLTNNNEFTLQPDMINPGEWFRVTVLTDGNPGDPEVVCRLRELKSRSMVYWSEEMNPDYHPPR